MNPRPRPIASDLHVYEKALDQLTDGIAIVRDDGSVRFANAAARAIAARGDGIRLAGGRIGFAPVIASNRYKAALQSIELMRTDGIKALAGYDFSVPRPDDAPAYFVSVRSILADDSRKRLSLDAAALVLIRDPLAASARGIADAAREVFGLTEAEARFADALCAGVSPRDYAVNRQVSLNTVYTHLRRIKTKTGCQRMPHLVARLTALGPSLRDL